MLWRFASLASRARYQLRLFLRAELLFHLEGDSIGVHVVGLGCVAKRLAAVGRSLGGNQDYGFDNQLSDHSFVGFAEELGQ